jgi:glycosyltransferase involved in cell wall biosynthesis
MNRLSICVVTQNEEHNLPRLLDSVRGLADEVVVLDGGSEDRTVAIAQEFGAKIFRRTFTTYAEQKNHAASLAANDWILLLDADEALSEELKLSIEQWKRDAPKYDVYEMARLTWYLGAWIRHSRWYPDWQRRLYRRDKTQFYGAVHEALRFSGNPGRLRGDLLHYTIRDFSEHAAKVERYTSVRAKEMFEQGKRHWRAAMWLATPWSWIHHFILGAGFLDGHRGTLIARMAARSVRMKFAKLGELVAAEHQAKQNDVAKGGVR